MTTSVATQPVGDCLTVTVRIASLKKLVPQAAVYRAIQKAGSNHGAGRHLSRVFVVWFVIAVGLVRQLSEFDCPLQAGGFFLLGGNRLQDLS